MNANELAEKIWEIKVPISTTRAFEAEQIGKIDSLISAALEEAEREKVIALSQQGFLHAAEIGGMKDRWDLVIAKARAVGYEEGLEESDSKWRIALKVAKQEAYEECAKIAETMTCGLIGVTERDSNTFKNYVALIAKQIRALRDKMGK